MKKIRTGVFETNSSSMHSISINSKKQENHGKIEGRTIITREDLRHGEICDTELEKLGFCIDLIFTILTYGYPSNSDEIRERVLGYFREILSLKCGVVLGEDVFPEHIADMYSSSGDPNKVFREYVKETFGKELVGDIDSPENLETTIKSVTNIIFDSNITILDREIM